MFPTTNLSKHTHGCLINNFSVLLHTHQAITWIFWLINSTSVYRQTETLPSLSYWGKTNCVDTILKLLCSCREVTEKRREWLLCLSRDPITTVCSHHPQGEFCSIWGKFPSFQITGKSSGIIFDYCRGMTLAGLYSVTGLQGLGCKCVDATAGSTCSVWDLKGELMTQKHVMLSYVWLWCWGEVYSIRSYICS